MSFKDYIYRQMRQETGKTFEEIYEYKHPEVVRCKECKYKDMELCAMHKLVVAGVRGYDDFCSYGEREGE